MKFFLRIAALALLLLPLHADEASDKEAIVTRAKQMIDSTFKADMTAVLKFMNPAVVEALGGKEALSEAIVGVAQQMKGLGLEFVSMDVQPPERFFQNGGKTFAVVKTKTVLEIPGKRRFTEDSSMIAIRDKADGEWTFVRVNEQIANNREILKKLLPEIPDDLKISPPSSSQSAPPAK